tara:strand:+ start:1426 stop:2562 length:1137 start_codon:yes stop_codon:yes gene_type:complete
MTKIQHITKFDIIIIGFGLSGVTLLSELLKRTNKNVLVLEKKTKLERDKTWCFWNKPTNVFTKKYRNSWKKIVVMFRNKKITKFDQSISYEQIFSDDLYNYGKKILHESKKSKLLLGQNINKIEENKDRIYIRSNNKLYSAKYIFDSRPSKFIRGKLVQHFCGIEVEANKNIFETDEVILMNFQKNTEKVHFFYILPYTKKRALVESTYLSNFIFNKNKYLSDIKKFLKETYPDVSFKNIYKEIGVIPMYRQKKSHSFNNLFQIGTADNWVRMSSGYAFQNSFKKSKELVEKLLNNQKITVNEKKVTLILDKIFCKFLQDYPNEAKNMFLFFFERLKLQTIVKFMNDDYNIIDLLKILFVLPKLKLIKCMFIVLFENE